MPSTKSVIAIDVDDSAFKRFHELFSSYSDEVDAMPDAWKKLGTAMDAASSKGLQLETGVLSAKEALALAAAQAGVVAEALSEAVKAQKRLGEASSHSEKGMSKLRKTAEGVGAALRNVGGWIVRIGAFAGLGGILSGIGFGDLAGATFARSRASGRLGLTPGALASYDVNAQQFLGREALEGAVAAQGDVTKGAALAGLGIDPRTANAMSPGDLAFTVAGKALAIYQRERKSGAYLNDPRLLAYQSQLGGDIGDLRNLAQNGGQRALDAARRNYLRDASALEIPRAQRDEWNKLKITLDRAGVTIQTVLIDRLSGLAPDIGNLTSKFVGLFSSFANTKFIDNAIHAAHAGLNALNTFLEPKNLHRAHEQFNSMVDTVKQFGAELKIIADKFKWLLGTGDIDEKKKARINAESQKGWNQLGAGIEGGVNWVGNAGKSAFSFLAAVPKNLGTATEIATRRLLGDYNPARIYAMNKIMSKKYGIHAGILDRLAMDESGYGRTLISPAGALGPYQFMPGTAKGYGINPLDTRQSADAAGKMLSSLFRKYHDWRKVIAAYNMGPGALDDDINGYRDKYGRWHPGHGANWLRFAPKETQGEVQNVVGSNAPAFNTAIARVLKTAINHHAQKPIHVTVHNSTAARVSVSANAVAVG